MRRFQILCEFFFPIHQKHGGMRESQIAPHGCDCQRLQQEQAPEWREAGVGGRKRGGRWRRGIGRREYRCSSFQGYTPIPTLTPVAFQKSLTSFSPFYSSFILLYWCLCKLKMLSVSNISLNVKKYQNIWLHNSLKEWHKAQTCRLCE